MNKYFLTLLSFFITVGVAFSQIEVPNGDFEFGEGGNLDNWDLTSGQAQVRNFIDLTNSSGTITIDPQSGDRFLTLMNGMASLGLLKNVFPITERPEIYAFYVGYISGVAGEQFGCGVCLTKYNDATGQNDTLLNIMGKLPSNGGQMAPWTKISANLEASYTSQEIPDMATIYFITDVAMNQYGNIIASPNTVMLVDNVHFEETGGTGIEGFTATNIESLTNYPNPATDVTTIYYELLNRTKVDLTIYDLNGREVINLVSEEQGKGMHSISVDATSLEQGIYIYKLQTEGFVESRKLMVK